ncbi:hypothetical protein [Rhizobium wuzhouense]|uniref:Uncharacterized protein n=1 Tax=Rhizobium wuzhouense TaxID=1986026 RepID=A0ABX5P064_9HYPH|nr:hypothetical protein [Rhizobium wuzhouense]PYB77356.1 hypothetical protein DMY87_03040 [Rhizobium wuzhouense]
MGNKRLPIALLVLCSWALPGMAAERIYCAASDAVVSASLETGFSKKDEQQLIHFRGIAGVRDNVVPPEFRRFELNSDMLRQHWTDGHDLRFSMQAFSPPKSPVYRVTMSIVTSRETDKDPRYEGTYHLAVQHLVPGSRVEGDILLDHEAPIFCAIKG